MARGVEVREVADGVNADLDGEGRVIGLDIDHASHNLDLDTLEAVAPIWWSAPPDRSCERHVASTPVRG